MQPYEYATMHRFEDHYWWYAGFRRILALTCGNFLKPAAQITLLDAGCGTGGNLAYMARLLNPSKLFAFDIHPSALELSHSRNTRATLLQASVNQVPFQKNVFDLITSLDVLCIKGTNDTEALQEFYRTLKPGGILLINLPAYKFLRGEHDCAVHTNHRYTTRELSQKLKSVGFGLKRITYWNSLFFPLTFIWRRMSAWNKNPKNPKSDFRQLPTWVNEMLKFVLGIETLFLAYFNLPFGTSILAVAEKPALDR